MTRTMKQISCFLLIATMVFSMLAIPGLAANTCNSISGSGDCGKVTTFTATTNGKWTNGSITLKGTKGTYSSYTWSNEEKTHSIYGYYKVTAKNTKTNKVEFSKKWIALLLGVRLQQSMLPIAKMAKAICESNHPLSEDPFSMRDPLR